MGKILIQEFAYRKRNLNSSSFIAQKYYVSSFQFSILGKLKQSGLEKSNLRLFLDAKGLKFEKFSKICKKACIIPHLYLKVKPITLLLTI